MAYLVTDERGITRVCYRGCMSDAMRHIIFIVKRLHWKVKLISFDDALKLPATMW